MTERDELGGSASAYLAAELASHLTVVERMVAEEGLVIEAIARTLEACFRAGGKVLLLGNGGSAADAQHVAAELVNRFRVDRAPLAAIALTVDSSVLTCIGNDASFEQVFARQVEALARPGDVVVGISTSGRSPNVLRALDAARRVGAIAVGFTGEGGSETMRARSAPCLVVPSRDTARIQEAQELAWHVICGWIEQRMVAAPAAVR